MRSYAEDMNIHVLLLLVKQFRLWGNMDNMNASI